MPFEGLGVPQQVFCNAKEADVYMSALIAGAMKPLKVLSKFENYFLIRTVSFQVQLEADGYFSAQKFSSLQPQQAGRVCTTSQFFESIFYKSSFKTLVGLRPNPIFRTKLRWLHVSADTEISKFSWRKICSTKIGVDSFNIASNRNYYFRF